MRHAIGLDLGGTNLKFGIAAEDGTILFHSMTGSGSDESGERVVSVMAEAAAECLEEAGRRKIAIESIGAGCPGTIDTVTGSSLGPTAHIPDWDGMRIAEKIRSRCGLPVYVDNDANTMAYGEYRCGAGRGSRFLVGVTLGTGVGGGIVLNGEIHHGAVFNAAEIGHVVVEADGRKCPCGNCGCMELYCAAKAIIKDTESALLKSKDTILHEVKKTKGIEPKTVFEAYLEGDAVAKEIIGNVAFYLGAGLTSVVNVLNPDTLVIGGGISHAGEYFIEMIRKEILGRVMKPVKSSLKIVMAELGNRAGLLGSALMSLHRLDKDGAI